ncbi:MAG: hypothetical protein JXA21_10790 [Anaerolineae bacterium]|nr:hypothetical protein [Anaerolineae bacterium]
MTITITQEHIAKLIAIESGVHYAELPPPGRNPFVAISRPSPVLLSAPHGAITYRHNDREEWHEEDEYTAGMALLLGELCQTSVIAITWRNEEEDPNYYGASHSKYRQALKQLVDDNGIQWVIDLHGASSVTRRMKMLRWVDLGTRKTTPSLAAVHRERLKDLLEDQLGTGRVSHNGFPAEENDRTITAYSHGTLGISAVQVEMRPAVRVAFRRTDASGFTEQGPFSAQPEHVIGMLQALADFIFYLTSETEDS